MQKQTQMVVIENFGSCNMRCTYCFPEHMWQRQGHKGTTTEETYRGALEQVFATTDADTVDVHLAGGEPLLAGRDWLEMALRAGREIAALHGKGVTFSLQTNATMVTPDLARFLADNAVHVGVSLDGPPTINEATRGNTERTIAGFRHLTEALGKRPGIIVTVTKCNAGRMPEVMDFLESLGVSRFRANQMGATASWNAHAAPHAKDWAIARRDLLAESAARRGRIVEFNISQSVTKFVQTLMSGRSPFDAKLGCCDIRCPAGRRLMYFDQRGNAYPCPRANVTPKARIGHYADTDFAERWDEAIQRLDKAMTVPHECRACPAQIICDYGCHAFNNAQGNFFEVNCDATKNLYAWVAANLHDVARVFLLGAFRVQLKVEDDHDALKGGVDVPPRLIRQLTGQLERRLTERLDRGDLAPEVLERRYGWREDLVPIAVIDRPRVSAPLGRPEVAVKGG